MWQKEENFVSDINKYGVLIDVFLCKRLQYYLILPNLDVLFNKMLLKGALLSWCWIWYYTLLPFCLPATAKIYIKYTK